MPASAKARERVRLEVKPTVAIKQDCKRTGFHNIMLFGRLCFALTGVGGLILEIELVKDGKTKGEQAKE